MHFGRHLGKTVHTTNTAIAVHATVVTTTPTRLVSEKQREENASTNATMLTYASVVDLPAVVKQSPVGNAPPHQHAVRHTQHDGELFWAKRSSIVAVGP